MHFGSILFFQSCGVVSSPDESKEDETLKVVSVRILLENLRREGRVMNDLEWLIPRVESQSDRRRLWAIRSEILEILEKDLYLKKGVIP